ncbi:MAG: hypothetical protein HYS18_06465 [Burkholderiales bacterium]|nr:hypothetical protein [Burkholderiales bacterium]
MSVSKNEVGPHEFWMRVCGVNTHRRGSNYAQLDTPWNAFTSDQVLVCTLWADRIITVYDNKEERTRRFVKIGGKERAWKGPAIQHGKDASENLAQAARKRLRVVGFEAEPNDASGRRQVKHFYLNRRNELQRVFDFSQGEMLQRLRINELFEQQCAALNEVWIEPGDLFELVASKGDFPGIVDNLHDDAAAATDQNEAESDPDDFAAENSSNEQYARACIPLLIRHVINQNDQAVRTLTYEDLADLLERKNKHGAPAPLGLGKILGRAMELIDQATQGWEPAVPYLTTIVVAKSGPDKGLPGVGVRERWGDYDRLTRPEKRAKMLAEHLKIVGFGSRWNDVLDALGLERLSAPGDPVAGNARTVGWGGGESDAHKALKAFVKVNPTMFGAPISAEAFEEYALRSGDEIDVFFKSSDLWLGVEVKSSISENNELDLQRGLYQVIKYRAVLESQAKVDHVDNPPVVKVLLVLGCALSNELAKMARVLDVEVMENILDGDAAGV